MNAWQFFGLQCRHRCRSRPVNAHQECLDCGADLTVDYSVSAEERAQAKGAIYLEPREKAQPRATLRFKRRA